MMYGFPLYNQQVVILSMFYFVDDYSRYSWLYPFYWKSDVFATFVKFKTIVEKFFSTSIKQIQTDNGGEFTSNQFNFFLTT